MTKRNPRSTNLNSLKGMIVLGSMMATLYGARQLAEPAAPTPAPAAQPNYVLVIPEPPPAIASLAPVQIEGRPNTVITQPAVPQLRIPQPITRGRSSR